MSVEFDSRKDSQSTKFEQKPQIFIKLSFRELCGSKLSSLHPFYSVTILHWVKTGWKQKGRLWVHETPILEVIFVTLTKNSYVTTNDTHRPQKYPHHQNYSITLSSTNMVLKLAWYFYQPMKKSLGCWFQVQSPYYQTAQRNQKTPSAVSSWWQVWESKKRTSINTNHIYYQLSFL